MNSERQSRNWVMNGVHVKGQLSNNVDNKFSARFAVESREAP